MHGIIIYTFLCNDGNLSWLCASSNCDKRSKFILLSERHKKTFVEMKMSSALSIRNKCTSNIRITTCSTEFLCFERESGVATVINELKFRLIKDIFTQKYVVNIKGHGVEQMRNLCMFLIFIGLCSVCFLMCRKRRSQNFNYFSSAATRK